MIDRRIGLEVIVKRTFHDVTVDRADNARSDAVIEAERAADRDHGVANPHLVAVAKGNSRQRLTSIDMKQRHIRLVRHAHHLSLVADAFGGYHEY